MVEDVSVLVSLYSVILVSCSYRALSLPEKFWCKSQNGQLGTKSPILKVTESDNDAHFHMICGVEIQMPTTTYT